MSVNDGDDTAYYCWLTVLKYHSHPIVIIRTTSIIICIVIIIFVGISI